MRGYLAPHFSRHLHPVMANQLFRIGPIVLAVLATAPFLRANAAEAAGTQSSLYARMGGSETVTAVVAELIDHSVADPKLKRSFEGVDVARVKRLLVEQICSLAGGGCTYSGDSMRDVHAGLKIEQSEFYGLVEVLREALRSHGVGLRERNELLAILAPMKRDVVER